MTNWHDRETKRFTTGFYARVPWDGEVPPVPSHYVHEASIRPGYVAYTLNEREGAHDVQRVLRPEVYLRRFYPHLTEDVIGALLWSKAAA